MTGSQPSPKHPDAAATRRPPRKTACLDPAQVSPAGPAGDGRQQRAKIFFITLPVDDLGRSLAFYRDGLGWPTLGVVGQEFHGELTSAEGTIAILPSMTA